MMLGFSCFKLVFEDQDSFKEIESGLSNRITDVIALKKNNNFYMNLKLSRERSFKPFWGVIYSDLTRNPACVEFTQYVTEFFFKPCQIEKSWFMLQLLNYYGNVKLKESSITFVKIDLKKHLWPLLLPDPSKCEILLPKEILLLISKIILLCEFKFNYQQYYTAFCKLNIKPEELARLSSPDPKDLPDDPCITQ